MKQWICSLFGLIGSAIATALGGWDQDLASLLIFMGLDYGSGITVAAVFHQSCKTSTGTLESKTCFKGLVKKCMVLVYVLVAYRLDVVIGTSYIRNAVIIAFIVNELISLTKNLGLISVALPPVVTKAIDILQKNAEKEGE